MIQLRIADCGLWIASEKLRAAQPAQIANRKS
jgi:hypothetical protein